MRSPRRSSRSVKLKRIVAGALAALFCAAASSPASAAPKKVRDGLYEDELIRVYDLHELVEKGRPPLLLDARAKKSYDDSHIAGARLPRSARYYEREELFRQGIVPKLEGAEEALAEGMRGVPKDRPIVTYCGAGCAASAVLCFDLKRLGFTDVKVLDEGFEPWRAKGYPVELK